MTQRRNSGGARHEASERVLLKRPGMEASGWTLNLSRGGVRVVLEDPVEVGDEFEVVVGDPTTAARPGRVVWVRDEADGQIVGVKFLDSSAPPPASPDAEID